MSERFIARVVNVDDPEEAGRVQIRVFGKHDDTSRIPDSDLPWARCVFPVTNPVSRGVSGPTTGLVVGSTVVGSFADKHEQVPLIDGVLGRNTSEYSDFPKANRGEDYNEVLDNKLVSIGLSELKYAEHRTIGGIKYAGQSIDDMIEDINESNFSGALRSAKDALRTFSAMKRSIIDAPQEQLNGIISGFASDLQYLVGEEIEDVITGEAGNVINMAKNIPGTLSGSSLLSQIESATGIVFSSANHLAGSIGTRTSKKAITNASDAVNRLNGHRFVMNNTMKNIDSALNKLKQASKKKK